MISCPEYANQAFCGDLDAIFAYHQYWIGALIGVALLFVDSFSRYDAFDRTNPAFVEFNNAPPSLLTTPLVYHQSLIVYYMLRACAFIAIAVVFPMALMHDPELLAGLLEETMVDRTRFNEELYDFVTTPVFPVIWAFASAGFVSLLPYYVSIEPKLRRFAQSVAFIAQSVQRRLNMISRSDLAAPTEPIGDLALDAFLREVRREDVDVACDWHSLEKRWARLAQILRMLDPSNRSGVSSRYIDMHPEPFQRLTEEFYSLRVRMRYHRTLQAGLREAADRTQELDLLERLSKHDPELLPDVNRLLLSAEKTLAAALPTSTRLSGRSSQRLRALGFELEEIEEDTSFGLVFVAILVGCLAGFFGTLLTRAVVELLTVIDGISYPDTNPLNEATQIIVYYAAIFSAVAIGALWLGAKASGLSADDIHPASYFHRPLGQYVFAASVGTVLSYLAVMVTIALVSTAQQAVASATLVAIFIPSLFMTNFLVLFPIYRPSPSTTALIGEALALATVVGVTSFITWVMFENAVNARDIPDRTPTTNDLVLGKAIFAGLRAVFVNAAVFVAVVYMAHQIREARRLTRETTIATFRPRLPALT